MSTKEIILMRYLRIAVLPALILLVLGITMASQINQTPRMNQQTVDKEKEQEKVRSDADRANALLIDSRTPIRSLGSLPNPPAPDQPEKATPAAGHPEINSANSKTKSQ
jgi:hypothetical protein